MFASLRRRTYRLLIRLYPAEFRREYGDDMVLIYEQLVADRGVLVATGRASIDLIVTVPRYRLEAVMTESQATRALTTIIAGLIVMGVSSLAMLGLPLVGAVLILAGVGLALAGRGRLARALRSVPDVSRRGRRLRWSALSAGVFAACVVGYFVVLWDNEVSTPGLLIPTLPGTGGTVQRRLFPRGWPADAANSDLPRDFMSCRWESRAAEPAGLWRTPR